MSSIIYALKNDPDTMVFDRQLFAGKPPVTGTTAAHWLPVAHITGAFKIVQDTKDGSWWAKVAGHLYTAQVVRKGDVPGIEVKVL